MSDENLSRIQKLRLAKEKNKITKTPEQVIQEAVVRLVPDIKQDEAEHVTHEIMTKPGQKSIHINGQDFDLTSMEEWVADSIETINASGTDDGTSREGEYFGWIEHGQEVITNMTDGFVSDDDLKDRNHLLEEFEQREVDLMICVSLYKNCNLENPRIRKKYDDICKKLQKLREIRSAIKTSTRDVSDEKKMRQREAASRARDKAMGLVYVGLVARLGEEMTQGVTRISDEQKQAYNIYADAYVPENYLENSLEENSHIYSQVQEGRAEDLFIQRAEQKEQTKEDVYNRLAVLSGRIVETPHKEPQSRPQAIDMNRYLQLKQMQQMRGLELG